MEEEHGHGLAHGHEHNKHAENKHDEKDKDRALYWGLGIGAAGLVVALLLFSQGKQKTNSQSQGYLVHEATPFIPNPQDISIGTQENIGSPLFWPGLSSGTPHKPKKAHHKTPKSTKKPIEHKPTSQKKYGKSPNGASHGHTVTTHTHNPVVETTTKGKAPSGTS